MCEYLLDIRLNLRRKVKMTRKIGTVNDMEGIRGKMLTLASGTQSTVVENTPVAGLAPAVIPTRHVDAGGCMMTAVKVRRAFVQILLAVGTLIASSTRTNSGTDAFPTVKTRRLADG